jgi:hypothetical protein
MMAGLFPLELTHLTCKTTDNPFILTDNPRLLCFARMFRNSEGKISIHG